MGDLLCVSLRVRTWFCTKLWRHMSYGYTKGKTTFLRRDNIFGRYQTPKRWTQLNTNHPRVLIPKFWSTASDRKVAKCENMLWYFHENTTNGNEEVYCIFTILVSNDSTLHGGNSAERQYRAFCTKRFNRGSLISHPARGLLSFSTGQTGTIVRIFFCYSTVWRAVHTPSLPSSMVEQLSNTFW